MGDLQGTHVYRAFISYSHQDESWGDWLHRALETYRTPGELVGRETPHGPVPARLTPVFRDRFDLPASGDLKAEILEALRKAAFQIVICSPRAAKSHWVNEEIKFFRKHHGEGRTLAVIIDGEPFADDPAEECFPPALKVLAGPDGALTETPAEPLAADARAGKDGKKLALSKLAAGLIGVKLDDLIQREAQRRARNARAVAGLSGVVAAVMAVLTFLALRARDDANDMRVEAENLMEFMLSDFKDELGTLGRLDVLDAVGARALDYYQRQGEARRLSDDALARRARALMLIGQIDQEANNLDNALASFREAEAALAELMRRDPDNGARIYDHAEAVFYVGNVHQMRREIDAAETYFKDYLAHAERLVALDPEEPKWRLEMAYATTNMGAIEFRKRNFDAALKQHQAAKEAKSFLMNASPEDRGVRESYATTLSWEAWTLFAKGNFGDAVTVIDEEISIYDDLLGAGGDDYSLFSPLTTAYRRKGSALIALGRVVPASQAFKQAERLAERLVRRDPSFAAYQLNASHIARHISELDALIDDAEGAVRAANEAIVRAEKVKNVDPTFADATLALIRALAQRVEIDADADAALQLSALFETLSDRQSDNAMAASIIATKALASFEAANGDAKQAAKLRRDAIAMLEGFGDRLTALELLTLYELYIVDGADAKAMKIDAKLSEIDLRHPRYVVLSRQL